jgi:hypothetical protein
MPNRTEARPAKAVLTYATGRLPLLRLFSTPLIYLQSWVFGLRPDHHFAPAIPDHTSSTTPNGHAPCRKP